MEGLYDYRTDCKWNILLFCRNNITNENQDLERKENGDRVSVLVFLVFKVDIYSWSKIKHGTKQSKCSRKEKQEGERDKAFYKQNHSEWGINRYWLKKERNYIIYYIYEGIC